MKFGLEGRVRKCPAFFNLHNVLWFRYFDKKLCYLLSIFNFGKSKKLRYAEHSCNIDGKVQGYDHGTIVFRKNPLRKGCFRSRSWALLWLGSEIRDRGMSEHN